MSKFKTVYGVYFITPFRDYGGSDFFDTRQEAEKALREVPDGWSPRLEEQTYELEEDSHHDCGDDDE